MSITIEETQRSDTWEPFLNEHYKDEIGDLAQHYPRERNSLYVEAADVYRFDPEFLELWCTSPEKTRLGIEQALSDFDMPVDVDLSEATVRLTDTEEYIRRREISSLGSADIGSVVAIEGNVGRVTKKKPRLVEGVFRCVRCETINRIPQERTRYVTPHECRSCDRQGPFDRKDERCVYRNERKLKLEEPITQRSSSSGRSVPVYLEGDICDYSPKDDGSLPDHNGERAVIIGVVNVDSNEFQGQTPTPDTDLWIDGRSIIFEEDHELDINIEEHREAFEALAARDDAVEKVANSIAPGLKSVESETLQKARVAAAAWLFNGYRADMEGLPVKRGDFHVGMFGDPGTGKSTIMQSLYQIAPHSEFRSGTGLSSEVGLTAAAVQEEFAGKSEWSLDPGILPRANGGHCMIDEVDAIVDSNTKAIHEALEGEQKIKVDKAGMDAELPTRTALMVGGNPEHTRFDMFEPITEQIDIDPALFDRLDLVFALTDKPDAERDRAKADHILETWDEVTRAEVGQIEPDEAEVADPEVPYEVLRAWVAYARETVYPLLTEPAMKRLKEVYVDIRQLNDPEGSADMAAVPATARRLEAGVRLSIAFARLRLSESVELQDAERSIELTKEVVGLRFDPESGQFDREMMTKGDTKSQRNRVITVKQTLENLQEHHDDGVPLEKLIEALDGDIEADKVEREVERLSHSGEIQEPRTNHYVVIA